MSVRSSRPALSLIAAAVLVAAFGVARAPVSAADSDQPEPGRFVWRDLMTRDVAAVQRFYGELLGWQFEQTRRGSRPYIVARLGGTPVAGIVDVTSMSDAGSQWISYLAVADINASVEVVKGEGGRVLAEPRDLPLARAAVVTDPQGAPLGLAQLRRPVPDPAQPVTGTFFWQEYLARDVTEALAFYKRLAGYESVVLEARQGIEYHVLRTSRGRAGLFRLPAAVADVEPNWLPYVLIADPDALAARVSDLGGRIVVPASPERRNGTLVVIADPGGAVLALQKYPF